LEVVRRMGAERGTLDCVPRAAVRAGIEAVRAARLRLCAQLAALACANMPGAQAESVRLSAGARRSEPGRYARIVLRTRHEHIAVTGAVVELGAGEVDALLSSALLWWARLNRRPRFAALRKLWLGGSRESREALRERLARVRGETGGAITPRERGERR